MYDVACLGCPRERNPVSGLAISRPTWNFQIRERPKYNLRWVTFGIGLYGEFNKSNVV